MACQIAPLTLCVLELLHMFVYAVLHTIAHISAHILILFECTYALPKLCISISSNDTIANGATAARLSCDCCNKVV